MSADDFSLAMIPILDGVVLGFVIALLLDFPKRMGKAMVDFGIVVASVITVFLIVIGLFINLFWIIVIFALCTGLIICGLSIERRRKKTSTDDDEG